MLSDWLKTQKKPTRTNQIRDVLTTKIQENGHGFQQTTAGFNFVSKTTIEKLEKIFQKPEYSKKYVFLAECIENAVLRKKYWVLIHEINHIWTAEMKWKWRRNLKKKKQKNKKSGLQWSLNPWPRDYRCDALPTELWSHWRWEQVKTNRQQAGES